MKLKAWLNWWTNTKASWDTANDFHIIKTCESCAWHKPCNAASEWLHGRCYKGVHSHKNGLADRPENFGCIHWEEKK